MTELTANAQQPKRLGPLFKWLRVFFVFYIVSEILAVTGSSMMLRMGSIMLGPSLPFTTNDFITGIVGLLLLLSYNISAVLFCIFSYRVIKNLAIFEVKGIEVLAGESFVWYFVPIAQYWRPYQAMQDMWIGSIHPDDPCSDTPRTMLLWWAFWLMSNFANYVSFRMGIDAGVFGDYASNASQFKTTLMLDIFSSVTGILAAWFILQILKFIAEAQDLRIDSVSG